jgi:aromatic ring-opening dioxygenase catalytic subunit (LigB family)
MLRPLPLPESLAAMPSARLPTYYLPHGGGPCFFMEWDPPDTWNRMAALLQGLIATLDTKPAAVVVVSGHWEDPGFAVGTAEHPPLLFDYYGFPEHTYRLTYPAPGDPALAQQVRGLLAEAGFATREEAERGFDHGVFVPFKLLLPEADVPIVQLSLRQDLDPAAHIAAGLALAPLRDAGVLIVGTGMSFHNLRAFGPGAAAPSAAFDAWLVDAATAPDPQTRNERLTHWRDAPAARIAHPREEHLLPLMVAAGAAGDDVGRRIYTDHVMGATLSAYRFG